MYFTRQQLEENEDKSLAPYGMRSRDTKGRAYLDGEPEYRTSFQRDRDRILHTTGNPIMNTASSGLGCPVVTVPRMAVEGMPLGIAITAQPHQDERATAIARWIGEAVPPIMA